MLCQLVESDITITHRVEGFALDRRTRSIETFAIRKLPINRMNAVGAPGCSHSAGHTLLM
jgi:hypothetical protein